MCSKRLYSLLGSCCPPWNASPQIMVIDSSEMFADFTAVVAAVADFAGLPEYSFEYNSSHEFKGGDCPERERTHSNDYFADGGRSGLSF